MEVPKAPENKSKLTLYIIIALVLGIALGFILNKSYLKEENQVLTSIDLKLEKINTDIVHASDSSQIAQLRTEKKALNQERNGIIKSREEKVEPFSLLADIFLRLIKMI